MSRRDKRPGLGRPRPRPAPPRPARLSLIVRRQKKGGKTMRTPISVLAVVFACIVPTVGCSRSDNQPPSAMVDWTRTRTVWVSQESTPLETIHGDELANMYFKAALVVPTDSWNDAARKAERDEASDIKIPVKIKCWLWTDFGVPAANDSGSKLELFSARIYANPDAESDEQIGDTGSSTSFAYSKKKKDPRDRDKDLFFYEVELEGQVAFQPLTADENRLRATGAVSGRVTRSGSPVEGVIVGVLESHEVQVVKSDRTGRFKLLNVPPGRRSPRWKTTESGRWTWYAAGGPAGFLQPSGSLDLGDLDLDKPAMHIGF